MTYLALLRGINVGGKNKVEMARLKTLFESIGCSDVRTYINSGNVIFTNGRVAARLRTSIEKAIAQEFGFDVRVVLRDLDSHQPHLEKQRDQSLIDLLRFIHLANARPDFDLGKLADSVTEHQLVLAEDRQRVSTTIAIGHL